MNIRGRGHPMFFLGESTRMDAFCVLMIGFDDFHHSTVHHVPHETPLSTTWHLGSPYIHG